MVKWLLTLESVTGMLEGGEPIIYEGQLIGAIGFLVLNLLKMLKSHRQQSTISFSKFHKY
jgi:hypothetical protein